MKYHHFFKFVEVYLYFGVKNKPGVVIEKESDNAFKLHMDDLLKRYKNIVCVNLVDQKGSEKKLADEYKNLCKTLYPDSNVKYFDFDFHHECRKMNYGAIQKLVDQVDDLLQSFKEFSKNDSKIQIQTGVMRTNCMDNLDRTNVVQSTFAKHHLNSKLKSLGILLKDESINDHHSFILKFKDVWANNADQISFMYSGTGALKNDFTRTGKRTFIGLLNDGSNSAIRYFLNNFRDGKRQDSMNLFLGKYIVNPKEKSPFQKENSLSYFYKFIGLAFITGIIMAISNILMLFYDPHDMKNRIAFLIGWLLFTFIVYLVLMFFGKDVVNNPVLVNTKKLIKRNNPYINDDILFKPSNSNNKSIYETTFETMMKTPQKKELIKLEENNESSSEFQNMNCPKSKDIRNYFKKK
eukprot:gene5408-9221_t